MIVWYQEKLGCRFETAAKAMVVLSAFSIPLGTAWMSISTALLFLFWLLSGHFRQKFNTITSNGVALWALGLYLLLAIGLTYTSADWDSAMHVFSKYKKILFIPIIISLMISEKWRRYAILVFIASMLIVLVMSYLKYLQILPYGPPGQEYTVFKGRIAHGIFMSFFFYLMVHAAILYPRWRWIFSIIALLAMINLLFLNTGRSGYVVFAALVVLLFFQYFNWRGVLISFVALFMLVVLGYFVSDHFRNRINESVSDVKAYVPGEYNHFSGLRYRLEFYQTTIKVIKKSPWFGHGTGSLETEYKKIADKEGLVVTNNPHNEFMMMMAQLGIIGLFAFSGMLYYQWLLSYQLDLESRYIVQGIVITMVSGCLLNSLLLDAGEGRFYVVMIAVIFSGSILKKQS